MKTIRQFISIVAILSLSSSTSFCQSIISLKINPLNPSTSDQIKCIGTSYYTSSTCDFKISSVSISNDTIKVISQHQVLSLAALCYSTDTIVIGQLPVGFYTLIFYLNEYQTLIPLDSDTLNFNLSIATNYSTNPNKTNSIKIYPNPTTSLFYIDLEENSKKYFDVDVFNFLGQKIISKKNINNTTELNLENEPNGTFFILIHTDNYRQGYKIQKNAP